MPMVKLTIDDPSFLLPGLGLVMKENDDRPSVDSSKDEALKHASSWNL